MTLTPMLARARGPTRHAVPQISAGFASEIPLDVAHDPLPPRLRPTRALGVMDLTEWFGDTTGGVRRYLLEKARYIAQHESLSQVVVVPGPDTTVSDEDGGGSRCYRLRGAIIPTQAPYRWMTDGQAIARIAEHERPDVIEVGSPWYAPWVASRIARGAELPLVWFFHGNFPRAFSTGSNFTRAGRRARRAVSAVAWRYVKRVSRLFDATLVASESTARDLSDHGVQRVERVPLGVDLDMFHPRRRELSDATRLLYGAPPTPHPVLAFMGRFAPEKQVDVLIDAWPEIERRTAATLLVVGAGHAERALRRRAEQSGCRRVLWRPFELDRTRVANLLAAVDCYIAPGSTETFGLAPLEALASGTPVLSADRGGVAEQVTRSGAGATFAAGDAEDLARAAIALLESDRAHLGQRGRTFAVTEHSWDTVFDRLFTIYRRLAQ